ncbi:hypothetical protein HanXRQr2_Chr05g0220261 [Helianthus annuus]|uniref:Uncharacterized protein n=1 Tax=Helianthus annuus TaxID=4232 RepID=A0A9K3NN32_HELAN|nr:hypothetical protein HanXRQr2_Chr05g0220261 [Helianthus annuus]KAJ0923173.1 hypothetical protein HanPSC8_Chr05g0212661 [Helianthus annuus]
MVMFSVDHWFCSYLLTNLTLNFYEDVDHWILTPLTQSQQCYNQLSRHFQPSTCPWKPQLQFDEMMQRVPLAMILRFVFQIIKHR